MKIPILIVGALSSLIIVGVVHSASFNCGKARTKVERIICGDAELSLLDESLAKAYRQALKRNDKQRLLIESQRQWLTYERNVCRNTRCIQKAYESRIKELGLFSNFGILFNRFPDQRAPSSKRASRTSKSRTTASADKPKLIETEPRNERR
jgi:uncharacterized protein